MAAHRQATLMFQKTITDILTSPASKMTMDVIAAFAEFERDLTC
jgi:DNA invertase Pin-like site-specific DNA recombinase